MLYTFVPQSAIDWGFCFINNAENWSEFECIYKTAF